MKLIYCGNGAFLPGIPARDLEDKEIKTFGGVEKLVGSGLYRLPTKKDIVGGTETKVIISKEDDNG